MSIYATLDGIICPQVASNKGWSEFTRWAESAADPLSKELRRLADQGWTEHLALLEKQLRAAMARNAPDPDVVGTVHELLDLIDGKPDGTVLTITDGMTN